VADAGLGDRPPWRAELTERADVPRHGAVPAPHRVRSGMPAGGRVSGGRGRPESTTVT